MGAVDVEPRAGAITERRIAIDRRRGRRIRWYTCKNAMRCPVSELVHASGADMIEIPRTRTNGDKIIVHRMAFLALVLVGH